MKEITNFRVVLRFILQLFVVALLASTCSDSNEPSEISDSLNFSSTMLLETQEAAIADTTLFPELAVSSEPEVIDETQDVTTTETVLRYITPTTTEHQSGVVVVPNFSEKVWNYVELADKACRESSMRIENFFECAPAIGKLCYYAGNELTDYRKNENRNKELLNALNKAVRLFCHAANYAKSIELAVALSYRYGNAAPEGFTRWLDLYYDSQRFTISRNFNFYDINTGNANIENILDLGDALLEYYYTSRDGINFEFVRFPNKISLNSEFANLISEPDDIIKFCSESIYFAKARLANWKNRIGECLHSSENYCNGHSFNEIKCRDISIDAKNERLWQDLPVICLQDANANSLQSFEICEDAATSIRNNYWLREGNYGDYGLPWHQYSNTSFISETITVIFDLERFRRDVGN